MHIYIYLYIYDFVFFFVNCVLCLCIFLSMYVCVRFFGCFCKCVYETTKEKHKQYIKPIISDNKDIQ